jgi:ureidoglycolate hydrolase
MSGPTIVQAETLTPAAYQQFGNVIAAGEAVPWKPANFGRAQRFNRLVEVENLRPETARLNVCVFRCQALVLHELSVNMLEKHPFSTQVFMPMQDGRYITIVALGAEQPDLRTLRAFVVQSPAGISYRPGIWHYPMTALGEALDLACLVYEDDGAGDCTVFNLQQPVIIKL